YEQPRCGLVFHGKAVRSVAVEHHSGVSEGQGASSAILAAVEQRLDLIVITEERNKQVSWPVLKNEPQRGISAALEQLVAEFANSQAAVHVRSTKRLRQLAQRQQALDSFALG